MPWYKRRNNGEAGYVPSVSVLTSDGRYLNTVSVGRAGLLVSRGRADWIAHRPGDIQCKPATVLPEHLKFRAHFQRRFESRFGSQFSDEDYGALLEFVSVLNKRERISIDSRIVQGANRRHNRDRMLIKINGQYAAVVWQDDPLILITCIHPKDSRRIQGVISEKLKAGQTRYHLTPFFTASATCPCWPGISKSDHGLPFYLKP